MREHEELAAGEGGVTTIKATALEQTFLETLLEHNSRFLSSGCQAQKRASEAVFRLSFLLPLGPLSFEDIAKLNSDPSGVWEEDGESMLVLPNYNVLLRR
jgi:hypothetical protein